MGTDPSGTLSVANAGAGITVTGNNSLIGGITLAARNIISGNGDNGISGQGASTNTVQGNFIGTDTTGTKALHTPSTASSSQAAWVAMSLAAPVPARAILFQAMSTVASSFRIQAATCLRAILLVPMSPVPSR